MSKFCYPSFRVFFFSCFKMPWHCSVYGCRGNYKTGPKVSIFRFPKDPVLSKTWTFRLMRKDFTPTKYSRVCELHFHEDDIVRHASFFDERTGRLLTSRLMVPRLREGAVPIYPLTPHFESRTGQPSKDPANPDYVPSVFDKNSKKTKSTKTKATPADDATSEKNSQVWTSLLNLQPITSEAGTSGHSEPPTQQKPAETEKLSTNEANARPSKPKAKPKPKSKARKRLHTASPTPYAPVENQVEDPLKLCVVKMEIEDDGYAQNEEESFLANLTSSSSQKSHNNTLDISFSSVSSIKSEPNEELVPTIFKLVPTINESAKSPSNDTRQDVEEFFKNVAQTVMQLPLHLIEETKTKVSSLVYEMVIQAVSCTNTT